jgi:transcriptional regulator with XRE-family HTH domain
MREHSNHPPLGAYLRTKRQEAGLSIRELARLAGVDFAYLSRLESGERSEPSAELLQRIADVLETDAGELLAYVGVKPVLPEPRAYFRKRYGVSEREAEEMARLLERFTGKNQEVKGQGKRDKGTKGGERDDQEQ